jgi:hypothetical protein
MREAPESAEYDWAVFARLTDRNFHPIGRGWGAFTRGLMKFGQRQANESFCGTIANSAWIGR